MNKGEVIRKLKRKMMITCKKCELTHNVLFHTSIPFEYCNKCPFAWFTNLMIKELDENV